MMNKIQKNEDKTLDRHILSLIKNTTVVDQQHLMSLLEKQGMPGVTQPTLSRRLKRLGISKQKGRYVVGGMGQKSQTVVLNIIQSPPNLAVIHTLPGRAQGIAHQLDQQILPGVAGTLAGDDVIFIALEAGGNLAEVVAMVRRICG
jgi:transcriptional regulator of arginine metabolism